MRIKRSDRERLVIVHFPLFLAVMALLPTAFLAWIVVDMVRGTPGADWIVVSFAAVFTLIWSAIFSFVVKRGVYDFDLVGRRLLWSRRSIIGKKKGIIPFGNIRGAIVDISAGGGRQSTYRPALATTDGTFPLLTYHTGGKFTQRHYERIAAVINAALQANPASAMEDEILRLSSAGQTLAAIEMARKRFGFDLAEAHRFVEGLTERQASAEKSGADSQ